MILGLGLAGLYFGAEWLVNGAAGLARNLGLSPILIGLTVVAFGTSAPELVVSIVSSVQGRSMIAVGNVIGSNICNIALVLGLSACMHPIESTPSVVRRDIPLMLFISFYLLLISIDSTISRIEGVTLLGGLVLYTVANYRMAMRVDRFAAARADDEIAIASSSKSKQVLLTILGIAVVVAGAELVVHAAVSLMTAFGVNEKFIGLTVVAFGTSLPELATSAMAAVRGEMDISIGNLIGSNVFNILSVLGAAALARPISIAGGFFESGLIVDYTIMIIVSALPLFMMQKDAMISRANGVALLLCYSGYLSLLLLKI